MKCCICSAKITWDNSYGHEEFLICEECFRTLVKIVPDTGKVLLTVCAIGELIEEKRVDK